MIQNNKKNYTDYGMTMDACLRVIKPNINQNFFLFLEKI